MHSIELKLALIGFVGIAAQWIAWRIHLPAIALLFLAGLIAGPFTGYLNPAADFGDVYRPMISLAVAIILFEGGLTLNFKQIRETSKGVRRIILFGGPMVWALGTLAGHYVGGLSWQTAILLGAILIVTGPTVIMPLLRQARLKSRPASLLRWEAIVNDPIGALCAVISFEIFLVLNNVHNAENLITHGLAAGLIALPGAYFLAKGLVWLFINGQIPEFLKAPVLVATALAANAVTNMFLEEAGLLTVTIMGITIANSRMASLAEMRRFKETITIMLVSAVFILLTASLQMETILSLGWEAAAFVFAILFVVRPVAIFLATIGAGLSWQERVLSAWIAPRGIVAVAVAGLFGATLVEQGIEDGNKMIAYTFAVVASTIVLHGFSLPILARLLDLRSAAKPGILIVGGSPWSVAFAERLNALEIPTMIADENWNHLRHARSKNLPTFFGDVLSEHAHHEINLNVWGSVITATDNDAYNALVCTEFGPEIGRNRVFQIGDRGGENHKRELHFTVGGRSLTKPGHDYSELNERLRDGWTFNATRITNEFSFEEYTQSRPEASIILFWIKSGGEFVFATTNPNSTPQIGARIISFGMSPASKDSGNTSISTNMDTSK
ncbi:MAG: sodium:proton antiporter [Salaquimonas sp.]